MRRATRHLGTQFCGVTLFACGMLASNAGVPQTASSPKSDTASAAQIPLEEFTAPRITRAPSASYYPNDEIMKQGEGWVELGFMVDTKGKPFEIAVLDSTGDKVFEQAAIQALQHATIEPGTVDGKPIDSASKAKFVFRLTGQSTGAAVHPTLSRDPESHFSERSAGGGCGIPEAEDHELVRGRLLRGCDPPLRGSSEYLAALVQF